eukprot:TRINITY_DN2035_c0_g2_i1.p1 TRINITY_DN2035_c0_g2~~TRINITY_DN2035_c0_g2_i1.p1  ORF type:complete len:170 (+),score=23.45 TRINITY_DN2035_c0_g2_i1:223-732(+)
MSTFVVIGRDFTMWSTRWASFLLLLLLSSHCPALAAEEDCEKLGFTGLGLCRDCNTFAEFIKDAELEADCRRCCIEETEDSKSKVKYAKATLEVCPGRVNFEPHLQAFIGSKAQNYKQLTVKYRINSPPKIILKDESGNAKETMRIDNWKTEHIEHYLNERLKGAVSAE